MCQEIVKLKFFDKDDRYTHSLRVRDGDGLNLYFYYFTSFECECLQAVHARLAGLEK